jgi:hypothetical protein
MAGLKKTQTEINLGNPTLRPYISFLATETGRRRPRDGARDALGATVVKGYDERG